MNNLLTTTALVEPVLSEQQLAIIVVVRDPKGGNIVIRARAGTGKTFAIVHCVVKTIYIERPRDSIAVMAYNKAAGKELKDRLTKAGLTDWRRVQAGTCHSFGFKAWLKVYPNVKVEEKKVEEICNEFAKAEAARGTEDHYNVWVRCKGAIVKTVSLGKQMAIGLLHPVRDTRPWYDLIDHHGIEDDMAEDGLFTLDHLVDCAMDVMEQSFKTDHLVIDFNDMILAPLVHKARFWPNDWVVLDEAQDTNPARRALAQAMLKPKWGRFVAVGDDRQAIYGFTGADSDSLDIIIRDFNATVLPLTVTYRCPKAVVAKARVLVPDYEAHPSAPEGIVRSVKHVHSSVDNQTGERVRVRWFETETLLPTDFILCRNTKPLVEEAYALIKAGIGCMVEGREIGKGLMGLATRWSRIKTLTALTGKLEEYREKEMTKWNAKGRPERAQQVEDRVGTLQVLIDKCTSEGKAHVSDLGAFIDTLFGDSDDEAPKVPRLMTIHKSKGRETPRVFHLGRTMYLPSGYARKEHQLRQEENLEYVGDTRAMEEYVDITMEG